MTYDVYARARRTTRRRVAAGLAVTAVMAAAVVTGLVLATGRASSPEADTASPPPAAIAPFANSTATTAAAGAVQFPADLRWTDVGGVALPVSQQAGPHNTAGGLASGFSHDAAGALLAAVHILVRITPQPGPHVFDPTLSTQVVGPDAAALREQVAQQYETLRGQAQVAYGQPVNAPYATLGGYRLVHYDERDAWLDLLTVTATADGEMPVSSQIHMTWTGQDWALVAPVGGTFDRSVSLVTDAARYHRFPGR